MTKRAGFGHTQARGDLFPHCGPRVRWGGSNDYDAEVLSRREHLVGRFRRVSRRAGLYRQRGMNPWFVLAVWLVVIACLAIGAQALGQVRPPETRPYSCRLLDDAQRKCAFGTCDARETDRLRKECLRDGGRP